MITILNVNGLELITEYDLDVTSVYLGDIETEYIDIDISNATASLPVHEDGMWINKTVDVSKIIKALEMEETLKLVLRDRMESIE